MVRISEVSLRESITSFLIRYIKDPKRLDKNTLFAQVAKSWPTAQASSPNYRGVNPAHAFRAYINDEIRNRHPKEFAALNMGQKQSFDDLVEDLIQMGIGKISGG